MSYDNQTMNVSVMYKGWVPLFRKATFLFAPQGSGHGTWFIARYDRLRDTINRTLKAKSLPGGNPKLYTLDISRKARRELSREQARELEEMVSTHNIAVVGAHEGKR